jgi:ABC-2 type transport system ATP-binding protein
MLTDLRPQLTASTHLEPIPTPAIHVDGVAKRFGPVQALSGVNLTVPQGEVVALLGPNGAGKSTLTRILSTLVLPDAGSARVCGHDIVAEPAKVRSALGVTLSDERSWYWRLTGRQNLEFFAALYGFSRTDARRRTQTLLELIDLPHAADRRIHGYSAGMKARLSLARALLPDPPVLLLDEPTRSLDPVATAEFRTLIRDLKRDRQISVLLTTHNLHEAAALADQVVVLVNGRIAGHTSGRATAEALETLLLGAMRA